MDYITNATLRNFITEGIIEEFAAATGYDWDSFYREFTMFGSGQIGRDAYKVSVQIAPLTSCDICNCQYGCTEEVDGNYLCESCGDEHLEWLNVVAGVSMVIPIEYRKYANVTVTGRRDGVDVVFHTVQAGGN